MPITPFEKSIVCPDLIGREKDLESLTRLIEQTAHSNGQVALVAGEAGIGKSRLVSEATYRAKESGRGCYYISSEMLYPGTFASSCRSLRLA